LIVVLWFLVLISAVAIYLLIDSRAETAVARNVRVAAEAEALADAGVAQAVFNQADPSPTGRWRLDGAPHRVQVTGGSVTIRLADEDAKINPNHASAAILAGLFEAVGVDRSAAQRLGSSVADWVSHGDQPRPLGAKKEQYAAAGRNYGPPNAPLESLDELQLVLGMTPEVFAQVRPYLTIYTAGDDPDPKTASPIVRNALQLAARMPNLDPVEPEEKSPDEQDAMGETGANQAAPEPPSNQAPSGESAPETIELEVIAETTDGGSFARHAVVRLDNSPRGYSVLDWRRADFAATQDPARR
jgi:general secretion pathway protein K